MIPASSTAIRLNTIERLDHDDRVAANHAHSDTRLLAVQLGFAGFIEDEIEENLTPSELLARRS